VSQTTVFDVHDDIVVDHNMAPTELMERLGLEILDADMAKALEERIWQNRTDLPDPYLGVWTPNTAEQSEQIVRPEDAIALVMQRSLNNGDWYAFHGYTAVYEGEQQLIGASTTVLYRGQKYAPVYDRNKGQARTRLIQTGKPLPSKCIIVGFPPVTVRTAEHHGPEQLHLCDMPA